MASTVRHVFNSSGFTGPGQSKTGPVIDQAIFGHVLTAGTGQASARQAVLTAGGKEETGRFKFAGVITSSVNKVCASGMKAIMLGAGLLRDGESKAVVVGGFESMSNAPFLLPNMRMGTGYGHVQALDSVMLDGLTDAYDKIPMGLCAEKTARDFGITREESDAFALESYKRALDAHKLGLFKELVPVSVTVKGKTSVVSGDEELSRFQPDKAKNLKPAFAADGTITVFNASKLNDGACAMVLTTGAYAAKFGLKPVARLLGWGDAEAAPIDFPTAPLLAIPVALARAGKRMEDIDLFELNEAFSTVCIAAMRKGISHDKINVLGGAVALGHPLGCSGARIVATLISALQCKNKKLGVAAICNGGGGASSVVIELL